MENKLIVLILVLGAINFSMRFFPALILNRLDLPEVVKDWLSFVPVATIAALVLPMLLEWNGDIVNISLENKNLLAGIPAIISAGITKSLGITLATGMVAMALLQFI